MADMTADSRAHEPSEAGLAVALTDRALSRTIGGGLVCACVTACLALIFVLVNDGRLDVRALPQVLVLGVAHLAGIACAAAGLRLQRRLRRLPSTAEDREAGDIATRAAVFVGRVVLIAPFPAVAIGVGCLLWLRPTVVAALSVTVALAIAAQAMIVLHVQRRALVRAAWRTTLTAGGG
jgi:hypothetical protein